VASSKLTILIAEDELYLALDIEDVVRKAGYDVLGPTGALSEIMRLIETAAPDAALLDVNLLHGELVYPAAALLASRNIPFVFMTAYGNGGIESPYEDRPVVRKPYTEGQIEALLQKLTTDRDTPSRPT
jgi:CheY-like chemotaxis protein